MGSNTLTIANSLSGGWDDQNPLGNDPGTSTVVFSNPGTSISGNASFYNVQIGNGADITNEAGSTMKIANSITKTGSGKWYADIYDDAIEYNGGDQTILLPDGTPSYHTLILSGSGIKTMPPSPMSLHGDLILNGTASATAGGALSIDGNVILSSGTTFNASSYTHTVSGNWTNNGATYTPGSSTLTFNSTTAAQAINGTAASQIFNTITINKTGQTLSVGGSTTTLNTKDLNITSGTFNSGTAADMDITGNWSNSGTFTAGSGMVTFNGTSAQTLAGINAFNNLTVNNTAGVTATANQSVNGILNLNSANASPTKGTLETGANTLTMGATATTTGTGDVTGIVKRTSFIINTPYTFGNPYTTLNLTNYGSLPTEVSFKIILSATHSWKPDAINRYYDIIQAGSPTTTVTLNLHYLDAELNGAIEGDLDLFDYHVTSANGHDHGSSNFNTSTNWVGLSDLSLAYIAKTTFDQKYVTIGTSTSGSDCVWLGISTVNTTDWNDAGNWTGGIPTETSHVHIPNTANHPTLPASTTIGLINIENGGVLNGGVGTTLTIAGASGAWDNLGTYNAGSSTVIFVNPAATMADPTYFYNVTIADGAVLTLGTYNVMGISGTLSLSNTGVLNAAYNHNTVEYNGSAQTVVYPNGSTPGYYNLILSGSGIKTLPATDLSVLGDFSLSGAATATTISNIVVTGNLTIGSTTKLNVGPGMFLTVGGTLSNAAGTAGLVMESDASGTGSLFHRTASVNATVQRYMNDADWTSVKDGWHFLSSPVASQAIAPGFTTSTDTESDFYCWNEAGNEWVNYKNTTSGTTWNAANGSLNFITGKGYMAAYNNAGIKLFTGLLNVSDVQVSGLTITGSTATNRSWHLLGNPFACALNWDASAEWNMTNIAGIAKIWNEANQSYSDISSAAIPATNGFMVEVVSGTGSLTIPASKRIHDAQPFYKSAAGFNGLKLVARNLIAGNAQECNIVFNPQATEGFDMMLDGEFLAGYGPQFYAMANNEMLSTDALPEINPELIIPFSFAPNTGNQYQIDAQGIETIPYTTYLLDKQTHTDINLTENPSYTFNSSQGDETGRFQIHFKTLGIPETASVRNFSIYASDGIIHIKSLLQQSGDVTAYDMLGRAMSAIRVEAGSEAIIPGMGAKGVYIVKAHMHDGTVTTAKVVLP